MGQNARESLAHAMLVRMECSVSMPAGDWSSGAGAHERDALRTPSCFSPGSYVKHSLWWAPRHVVGSARTPHLVVAGYGCVWTENAYHIPFPSPLPCW